MLHIFLHIEPACPFDGPRSRGWHGDDVPSFPLLGGGQQACVCWPTCEKLARLASVIDNRRDGGVADRRQTTETQAGWTSAERRRRWRRLWLVWMRRTTTCRRMKRPCWTMTKLALALLAQVALPFPSFLPLPPRPMPPKARDRVVGACAALLPLAAQPRSSV